MKPLRFSLAALAFLALFLPQAHAQTPMSKSPAPATHSARALEGTLWTGQDSDGSLITYEFVKGGHLKYTSQDPGDEPKAYDDPEDLWAQNGDHVLVTTSHFATRIGTLDGDRITGLAWNVRGDRWTWELKRKR